jgi:hypothetical protein
MFRFDLACNHVSLGKFRVVKNRAEGTLGQEMLYEHFLDSLFGKVRVDRCSAKLVKGVKRGLKIFVVYLGIVVQNRGKQDQTDGILYQIG